MEMDIVEGNIGEIGMYDVEFKGGKLVAMANGGDKEGMVVVKTAIELDAGKVMDAIAKAIPGTVDDAILAVMKSALLGK